MVRRILRSILPAAALLLASSADADLTADLTEQFAAAGLSEKARLAVMVSRISTGERLAEINTDVPMKPASTTKLFTATSALEGLGPDWRTKTTVEIAGDVDAEGTLKGMIVIRGGGDPGLGPRFQDDKSDVVRVAREWAQAIKKQGIKRVAGDVVGDDTLFTGPRHGPNWYDDEAAEWYMAEIAALTYNDGCVDITFKAKDKPGKPTDAVLVPDIDYFTFKNAVEVVDKTVPGQGEINLFRHEAENRHVATGTLPEGKERTRWTSVMDPARFVAALLISELQKAGVVVDGLPKSTSLPSYVAPDPAALRVVVDHPSAPLRDQLVIVLANSQNLYAESVGRHAAIAAGKTHDFQGASEFLMEWTDKAGLRRNGFLLMDASGLSSLNRIPARSLHDLVVRIAKDAEDGPILLDAMARPGDRGSLKGRLPDLKGRLRAKTGTLGDTSTIAGVLKSKAGDDIAVVVMIDSTTGAEALLDSMLLKVDEALAVPAPSPAAAAAE